MKAIAALGLISAVAMAAASPATAAQGCGPGMHRAPNGTCHPNRGPMAVTWVEGRFYPGHGYWYHNRWYQHRVRWHNDWRYR
ncbi:MAG TPA: hypothetical protein VE968_00715 [Sphingomicrobium sp.]|nr:hypothetical protein [Sphingomicrobium sp.]